MYCTIEYVVFYGMAGIVSVLVLSLLILIVLGCLFYAKSVLAKGKSLEQDKEDDEGAIRKIRFYTDVIQDTSIKIFLASFLFVVIAGAVYATNVTCFR